MAFLAIALCIIFPDGPEFDFFSYALQASAHPTGFPQDFKSGGGRADFVSAERDLC